MDPIDEEVTLGDQYQTISGDPVPLTANQYIMMGSADNANNSAVAQTGIYERIGPPTNKAAKKPPDPTKDTDDQLTIGASATALGGIGSPGFSSMSGTDSTILQRDIFSPSDQMDTLSDISVESPPGTKSETDKQLSSRLLLYGSLDPSLNIDSSLKEQIGAIRLYVRKVSRMLRKPQASPITNVNDAQTFCSFVQDIIDIQKAIHDPPEEIFGKISDTSHRSKILQLFKQDVETLNRYGNIQINLYKKYLSDFEQAKRRVERVHSRYETRQTSNILHKGADIPAHFFEDTPQRKKRRDKKTKEKDNVTSLSQILSEVIIDSESSDSDIELANPSVTPALPWESTSMSQENLVMEKTFANVNRHEHDLLNFIEQSGLIPKLPDHWNLSHAIEFLNKETTSIGIKMHIGDPDLESKLAHIAQNKDVLWSKMPDSSNNTTIYYTPEESTLNTSRLQGSTGFYTPVEVCLNNKDKGFSPMSSRAIVPKKLGWPDINAHKVEPQTLVPLTGQGGNQNFGLQNKDNTEMSDILRFQREANNPSVRSKWSKNSKNCEPGTKDVSHNDRNHHMVGNIPSGAPQNMSGEKEYPWNDSNTQENIQTQKYEGRQMRSNPLADSKDPWNDTKHQIRSHSSEKIQYPNAKVNQYHSFTGFDPLYNHPSVLSPRTKTDQNYAVFGAQWDNISMQQPKDSRFIRPGYIANRSKQLGLFQNHPYADINMPRNRGSESTPHVQSNFGINTRPSAHNVPIQPNANVNLQPTSYSHGNITYPNPNPQHMQRRDSDGRILLSQGCINKIKKMEIELDLLQDSTENAQRIIRKLCRINTFNLQEMQDLLTKLPEYNRTATHHRKIQVEFNKSFIDIENDLLLYNIALYHNMRNAYTTAANQANELSRALSYAEEKVTNDRITIAQVSSLDSKEIIYWDFSGSSAINDKNIYEVITNHEINHKINRTNTELKGVILKKHLKGAAKLCIPDDVENYSNIKQMLIQQFGNENAILTNLFYHHNKIGCVPPKTGSAVQWAKIAEACKAHLTLLRRADTLISNSNTAGNLINEKYVTDLMKFLSQEDRYEVLPYTRSDPYFAYQIMGEKFNNTLSMSQEMMRITSAPLKRDTRRAQFPEPGASEFGLIANYELATAKDCEICQILQHEGDLDSFFENHMQSKNTNMFYNSQCPLYLKMKMEDRLDFLRKHNFCAYCVNVLQPGHKMESCRSKNLRLEYGRVLPYTCRDQNCPNRLELCLVHKGQNMEALTKRKDTLSKHNIEMCLASLESNPVVINFGQIQGIHLNSAQNNENTSLNELSPKNKVAQWLSDLPTEKIKPPHAENNILINNTSHPDNHDVIDMNTNGMQSQLLGDKMSKSTTSEEYISTAYESNDRPLLVEHKGTLLKNAKVTGYISSQSKPLFMFMRLQGRSKGINLVFDSGASALICTHKIPGIQLQACRTTNETVELQGLGATKKTAQSWTMLLPLADNNLVATQAYSVEHILGPMNAINLAPALKMIKQSAPDNELVQQSQIYEYLGGNIEILAGIRLNALFPEKIFQMSNGLALYKLKLASHNPLKAFCLGGPYEVINEMKNIFKESAYFLNEIETGLSHWRKGNTPYIKQLPTLGQNPDISQRDEQQFMVGIVSTGCELETQLNASDLQDIDEYLDGIVDLDISHCNLCCGKCSEIENHVQPNEDGKDLNCVKEPILNVDFVPWIEQHPDRPNAFIAIEIGNISLKNSINKLQNSIIKNSSLVKSEARLNAIPRQRLHISIMVMKQNDTQITKEIFRSALEDLNLKPFDITFDSRVMVFPDNRTAYLMPDEKTRDKIINIQAQIFQKFVNKGVLVDNNKVDPHLTIFKGTNEHCIPEAMTSQTIVHKMGTENVTAIKLLSFEKHYFSGKYKQLEKIKLHADNISNAKDQNNGQILAYPNMQHMDTLIIAEISEPFKKVMQVNGQSVMCTDEDISFTPFVAPKKDKALDPKRKKGKNTQQVEKTSDPNSATLLKNLEFIIDGPKMGYRCFECHNCSNCKKSLTQETMSMREHLENYLIEKSVKIDRTQKCFTASLPLTHDPDEMLISNERESQVRHRKVLQKLERHPSDREKINNAFNKLVKLNYIVKLSCLPEEVQTEIKSRKVVYYIPWDYVSKPTSYTTEKRQVYDASAKTKSGHSLNDILCKGCPKIDFDPMILNFVSNKYGLCADLQKFYQSVHLNKEHYHLQLMWWTDSMSPDEEPETYVITRLTFGLKSSSQQLEHCIELLAEENANKPMLYRLLKNQRYVDDLMGSYGSQEEIESLIKVTDETLKNYGLVVKGYCQSFKKPSTDISDGNSIMTGGYIWQCELDVLFIRIQPLHYSEKKRGEIMTNDLFIEGSFEELDAFVPKQLTLRQVLSRGAQVFDPLGLVTPWKTGIKILTRESLNSVNREWDEPLSKDLRERWVKKFWDMQLLKEIGFKRCTLPLDRPTKNPSLICFCDAGKHAKVQVVYLLNEIGKGKWHSQIIYSKSQLVQPNKTLPNMELDSLNTGAELLNKCCNSLPDITRICLVGDSLITSYWVAKDTISLATYQRNRVSNIRRLVKMENIFHCKGEENVSDIGTKIEEPLEAVLPGSPFNTGPKWLELGIVGAVTNGYLAPIQNITISPSNNEMWSKASDGLVGKCTWPDELLMRNNESLETYPILSINEHWVSKVKERYAYSNYLIDPLRKTWSSTIRSLSISFFFLHKVLNKLITRNLEGKNDLKAGKWTTIHQRIFDLRRKSDYNTFCQTLSTLFATEVVNQNQNKDHISCNEKSHDLTQLCNFSNTTPKSLHQSVLTLSDQIPPRNMEEKVLLTEIAQTEQIGCSEDSYIKKANTHILDIFGDGLVANFFKSIAILYFLKKASKELETFYVQSMIKKHCYKVGSILFSRNRWLETNQLKHLTHGDIQLLDFQIQESAPALDRHSPIAISLALHFHHVVGNHPGVDRSFLISQRAIFIFQGQRLFEEICRDCLLCRRKIKQKYNQTMGPLSEEQLTYSAVGRFLFLDMSGPYLTKISPKSKTTRRTTGTQKVWLLHGVCVVSNYSVVQVLESYATDSFVQAVHRMASYLGYPQVVLIDPSQTEIKGMAKTKFSMYDITNKLYEEMGITMKVCPVGPQSHAKHGIIERRIALFKKFFEIRGAQISDLTPIGLYTIALQAATHLNCMPLATKKRHGCTISSQLITPTCFFLGKQSSHRAPADIPEMIEDYSQMLDNLQTAAEGMREYFMLNIPDLLLRTCWEKNPQFNIKTGDLVLFMKDESPIAYNWKLGIVSNLEKDADGEARTAEITYVNSQEIDLPLSKNDKTTVKIMKRITRKSSYTIAKIHSIDEDGLQTNLAYLNALLKEHRNSFYNSEEPTRIETTNTESPLPSDISRVFFMPQLTYLLENKQ